MEEYGAGTDSTNYNNFFKNRLTTGFTQIYPIEHQMEEEEVVNMDMPINEYRPSHDFFKSRLTTSRPTTLIWFPDEGSSKGERLHQ